MASDMNSLDAVILDDDITKDNFFLTWKTRWHLGDTHIGAGLYVDGETGYASDSKVV